MWALKALGRAWVRTRLIGVQEGAAFWIAFFLWLVSLRGICFRQLGEQASVPMSGLSGRIR